jgi:superfamily II DNA or RNA helicase
MSKKRSKPSPPSSTAVIDAIKPFTILTSEWKVNPETEDAEWNPEMVIDHAIVDRFLSIPRHLLTTSQEKEIREQCLVQGKKKDYMSGQLLPPERCWTSSYGFIHVPVYWGRDFCKRYNIYVQENPKEGQPMPSLNTINSFSFLLDEHGRGQVSAFRCCMHSLQLYGACFLCLKPGQGKTKTAETLALNLGRVTLVLVHMNDLLGQWTRTFEKDFPGIKVAILHGVLSKKKIQESSQADVIITTYQTLHTGNITARMLKNVGTVIMDEAHHLPANTFRKAMCLANCKYRISLTGTPARKDGMEKISHLEMGPITFERKPIRDFTITVNVITPPLTVSQRWKSLEEIYLKYPKENPKIDKEAMVVALTSLAGRTQCMVDTLEVIWLKYQKEPTSILILDERNEPLQRFYERAGLYFAQKGYVKNIQEWKEKVAYLYTGSTGKSKAAQKENVLRLHNSKFIFSNDKKAGESSDIPDLFVQFLVGPFNDTKIEQIEGRILRTPKPKIPPCIYTFCDPSRYWYTRRFLSQMRYYRLQGGYHFVYPPHHDRVLEENGITHGSVDVMHENHHVVITEDIDLEDMEDPF